MSFRRCERSGFGYKAAAAVVCALFLAGSSSPGQRPSPRNPQPQDASTSLLAADLRAKDPPALTAQAIVEKMMSANGRRSAELRGYQAIRSYNLEYRGLLGSRSAEMKGNSEIYRSRPAKLFRDFPERFEAAIEPCSVEAAG
jgi:hypothetical protein